MSKPIASRAPGEVDVLTAPFAADDGPDWRDRAAGWIGGLLSLAVLVLVTTQLGRTELERLAATAPRSVAFWTLFLLYYLCGPACEWLIFRHLWRLPATGLLALLRKNVSNELLFGYSGEAQFYLWARRHVPMTGSPFGAVKDVAMLSAVAGSLATLLLMIATAPMLMPFATTPLAKAFAGSVAVIIVTSLGMFLARRTIFSLPGRELWIVFGVHGLRIAIMIALAAAMWHLLLPSVALSGWMVLATLRMMISRLPLVSNKDILFAGLALFLLGKADGVTGVIAMVSSLIVGAHLVIGAATYAAQLAARVAAR